jgi:hypothetical protein
MAKGKFVFLILLIILNLSCVMQAAEDENAIASSQSAPIVDHAAYGPYCGLRTLYAAVE